MPPSRRSAIAIVQAAARIVLEPIFEADMLAVLVRVPSRALGARRAPGTHR